MGRAIYRFGRPFGSAKTCFADDQHTPGYTHAACVAGIPMETSSDPLARGQLNFKRNKTKKEEHNEVRLKKNKERV